MHSLIKYIVYMKYEENIGNYAKKLSNFTHFFKKS